jgi:hypothetical protein
MVNKAVVDYDAKVSKAVVDYVAKVNKAVVDYYRYMLAYGKFYVNLYI